MIDTITPKEMRDYEMAMMKAASISSETLMELAARAVAETAEEEDSLLPWRWLPLRYREQWW